MKKSKTQTIMIKNLSILLSFILYTNYSFSEIQYFLDEKYHKNTFSISINGIKNVFWSPGSQLDKAIESYNKIKIYKCSADKYSTKVLKIYPDSFYNPQMNIFQTDLRVLNINNSGQVVNSYKVTHKTVTRMMAYEAEIAMHYEGLIKKFMDEESTKNSMNEELVSGRICFHD